MALAAADAALQAAQASVRAAHALVEGDSEPRKTTTGCELCGSQDLRKAEAMGETSTICGACGHVQEG